MKFLRNLLSDKKKLLSVALALALAWLFYRATCAGGSCIPLLMKGGVAGAPAPIQQDVDGRCYRFDKFNTYCQFPIPEGHTDYIPGGSYQDPGYFQNLHDGNVIQYGKHGSIGATYEGFGADSWRPEQFTAGCLGHDPMGTEYPSSKFHQVACKPEPKWNLPRDARVFHQAMYPCGVPGQCNESKCYKHHPMDSVFSPPNEGIMTRQVRN